MAFSHIDCGVGDFMCGECQRAADEHTDAQQECDECGRAHEGECPNEATVVYPTPEAA